MSQSIQVAVLCLGANTNVLPMTTDENQVSPRSEKNKYPNAASLRVKVPLAVDPKAFVSAPPKRTGPYTARALQQVYLGLNKEVEQRRGSTTSFKIVPHMTRPLLDDSAPLDLSILDHLKGVVNVEKAAPFAYWGHLCELCVCEKYDLSLEDESIVELS